MEVRVLAHCQMQLTIGHIGACAETITMVLIVLSLVRTMLHFFVNRRS